MLHVLPQAKLPVTTLPLDSFVTNHLSMLRKKERGSNRNASAMMSTAIAGRQLTQREEMEENAVAQGLFMIPEFQFDHCFFQLDKNQYQSDPATHLGDVYKRCAEFLRFSTRPDIGVSVIISPRWFFLGILTQPYCHAPNGNPVYLDGFDFSGLVSLQDTVITWPGTAGLEDQTVSIYQAFANSTKVTAIGDEDDGQEPEVSAQEAADGGRESATVI